MVIIDGNITAAYRCPECGNIKIHEFSIFELSKSKKAIIGCNCSKTKMHLSLGNNGVVWIKLPCIGCDLEHMYKFTLREIIKSKMTVITCPNIGIELCFIGDNDQVREVIERHIDDVRTLVRELDLL
jgi:exosome complex RNA-binding protein Rrp4